MGHHHFERNRHCKRIGAVRKDLARNQVIGTRLWLPEKSIDSVKPKNRVQ